MHCETDNSAVRILFLIWMPETYPFYNNNTKFI